VVAMAAMAGPRPRAPGQGRSPFSGGQSHRRDVAGRRLRLSPMSIVGKTVK
jgi:hypothetical protein